MIRILNMSALDYAESPLFISPDVQILDPPYTPHVHENAASVGVAGGGGMGAHSRDLGFGPLSPELLLEIGAMMNRTSRWSIVFSDLEGSAEWRYGAEYSQAEYIRQLPWVRWTQPQLSGDRPPSGAEAVNVFHSQIVGPRGGLKPVKKHWNGPGSLTHFRQKCLRGKDKHPTEKPLDLMLALVCYFSDPGEHVLDMCGGRGTTALACRILGRSCTSLEKDPIESDNARKRLRMPLSDRDRDRADRWIQDTFGEASSVPEPKAADGSDVKTYERAQRRLDDIETACDALSPQATKVYEVEVL